MRGLSDSRGPLTCLSPISPDAFTFLERHRRRNVRQQLLRNAQADPRLLPWQPGRSGPVNDFVPALDGLLGIVPAILCQHSP